MKKKYEIVYSIGRDCACSMYMKSAKLRICSGPFDWLTNASFETRIDCIINDFKDFLNFADLAPLQKSPNLQNDDTCDYYQNVRNGFFYYHDFPVGVALEQSFPQVKEKYQRRINRFYKKISEKDNVLLIWFSHHTNTPDKVILDASKRMCEKFGKQIDFLIIEHSENTDVPIERQLAPNIIKYNLHTKSYDGKGNVDTLGLTKNILPIFSNYKLKQPLNIIIIRYFRRILSDIICLLFPVKQFRGKIKHFIRGKYE